MSERRPSTVLCLSPPTSRTPDTVRETFELASEDLDIALANAVRTIQLRRDAREENGWVPVQPVDQVLRTQFEAAEASPPSIEELGEIRDRSRLLEVTLDQEHGEIVVRLTDEGEAVTEPDTGDVRSSGSDLHDELLFAVERELSRQGFDVTVFTQDGSEKPDGRAVHPDCEHIFDIEVESTTVDKPVKILRNFQRAQDAGHVRCSSSPPLKTVMTNCRLLLVLRISSLHQSTNSSPGCPIIHV